MSLAARGLGLPRSIIVTYGLGRVRIAVVYAPVYVEGALPLRGPAIVGELAALADPRGVVQLRGPAIVGAIATIVEDVDAVIAGDVSLRGPTIAAVLDACAAGLSGAPRLLGPVIVGELLAEEEPAASVIPVVVGAVAARAAVAPSAVGARAAAITGDLELRGPVMSAALQLGVAA